MSCCSRPCGCCAGIEAVTPVVANNRPGLPAISYRVGTHGQFLETMLARLSGAPELRQLTARDPDDLAIALLDGWATVADVLSFYSERLANEGFLRTATSRQSIALLGALVGYQPRPGLGASTYLAYTVDSQQPRYAIPAGSRVQNLTTGNAQPQSYETSEDLVAAADWNDLPVRKTAPTTLTLGQLDQPFHLAGTTTNVKPGDLLLFDFGSLKPEPVIAPVVTVTVDAPNSRTQVAISNDDQRIYDESVALLADALTGFSSGADPLLTDAATWIIAPLRTAVQQQKGPRDLAPHLRTALRQLSEDTAIAEVQQNTTARHALDAIDQAAQATLTAARTLDPAGAAIDPAAGDGELGPDPGTSAVLGLTGLLTGLRTPPSVQPANSAALNRDPRQAFGAGSATGVQLLTAADPRLAAQLYTAWSGANLTTAGQLRSLQVLRLTAAPFGANAPLQPVLDDRGVVIDHREWLRADDAVIQVTVDFPIEIDESTDNSAIVTVSYRDAARAARNELDFSGDPVTVPIGDIGTANLIPIVDASGGWLDGMQLTLSGGLPHRSITVPSRNFANSTTVTVTIADADRPSDAYQTNVSAHQVSQGTMGADPVSVSREPAPTTAVPNPPYLTITDTAGQATNVLDLDAVYPGIAKGDWVVIERDGGKAPIQVTGVATVSVAAYGLTGRVTELTLAAPWLDGADPTLATLRRTNVRGQGQELTLAESAITDPVSGAAIELALSTSGLETGRWLVVSGERTDLPSTGVPGAERVMLAGINQLVDPGVPGDTVHTQLVLAKALAYQYRRDTLHIYGNVVAATQGESRAEPLGSGDASRTGQSFTISKPPLTWLPADTPTGAQDTLLVRVDGVRWQETDTLATAGPTDRKYVLRRDTDTVIFGDGVHGSRLPTGVENVTGGYRTGIGTGGNVPAGAISQLASKPLGVRSVTNPLPATGAADPDDPALARRNTPLRTLALDRLVSLRDYQDFSAAFAGIGKASARRLTDGTQDVVHVTVAGINDAPVDPDSQLLTRLRAALATFGEGHLPVRVVVRELKLLLIAAKVKVLPDFSWPLVRPVLTAALLDRFSAANRDLGQPVFASEVLSVMQNTPGVDYVDLDVFAGVPGGITPAELVTLPGQFTKPEECVPANLACYERVTVPVVSGDTLSGIAANAGISLVELAELNPWLPNADLPADTAAEPGGELELVTAQGIRPAQLAVLSPDVPDSLILQEITS